MTTVSQHPLPPETLRRLLRYDPTTGRLYWRGRGPSWFVNGRQSAEHVCARWNARFAGREAFTARNQGGYLVGAILGRDYAAHRVAFALVHRRWPAGVLDHRDGDKANNRDDNLREATQRQNNFNAGSRGGTSRFCGVCWDSTKKRWLAQGRDAVGRSRYLGRYLSEEDAARAYDAFAAQEHGDFARLNFAA